MKKKQRNYIIIGGIVILLIGWWAFSYMNRPEYDKPDVPRPFKGRADAAVVVTEYSDFQCPACKGAVPFVQALDEQYGANIKIEYRHLPLQSIHPLAFDAAVASECANDQGKFWEMHDLIFGYQPNIGKAQLREIADTVGLDMQMYDACMGSRAHVDTVKNDLRQAQSLGLNSTPSFLLNGEYVRDRAQLERMILEALGRETE